MKNELRKEHIDKIIEIKAFLKSLKKTSQRQEDIENIDFIIDFTDVLLKAIAQIDREEKDLEENLKKLEEYCKPFKTKRLDI